MTASGKPVSETLNGARSSIRTLSVPSTIRCAKRLGSSFCPGNLFDSALMKTSVISEDFRARFLKDDVFEGRPSSLKARRITTTGSTMSRLRSTRDCILFIRNVGCVGYPGSAEVVNMQPPDAFVQKGINHLPTVGDGRQSGTSESPSILNASPEAVVGGGLALLQTGDQVELDLNAGTLNVILPDEEWQARKDAWQPPELTNQTPWQEIYRANVGQLAQGGCLELATAYQRIAKDLPRDKGGREGEAPPRGPGPSTALLPPAGGIWGKMKGRPRVSGPVQVSSGVEDLSRARRGRPQSSV
jgi:dihydroxyacid dehydratase/phosphogluconate dehydratase